MKCRTCNFQNESPSNFCASCGAALTNTKTPAWLWIMILFFTVAFGSPQGLENTAAPGYITGHDRDMEVDRFIYKQIYQLDAQVDQGSSGGPLIDATSGKVVGINSLLFTSETSTNFAFSIPVYSMLEHFDQWMKSPMTKDQILAAAGYYDTYNPPTAYYEQEEEYYEEEVDEEVVAEEEEVYEEPVDDEDNAQIAGQFVQSFRMSYEQSLNTGDFYWIADMLTGNAYAELEEYVADIAYNGHTFEFLGNDILSVNYNNGAYLVETNETFDFYPADGNYEYFDRYKTYTVLEDEYGAFKISTIKIHE